MSTPGGMRPAEDAAHQAAQAAEAVVAAQWDAGLHDRELHTAHQGSTVNGTPASGEGHGPWPRGVI